MASRELSLELKWLLHNSVVHPVVGSICFAGWNLRQRNHHIGQGLINFGTALHDILTPHEHPKDDVKPHQDGATIYPFRSKSAQ